MAHVAEYRKRTPEKWQVFWNHLKTGRAVLILTEPLISEIYYRIQMQGGKDDAENYLVVLKSRKNVRVIPEYDGDKMAFEAGRLKVKHSDLSLVDCYILAAALTEGATVFTADQGIMEAAAKEGCKVSFIPKRALDRYVS